MAEDDDGEDIAMVGWFGRGGGDAIGMVEYATELVVVVVVVVVVETVCPEWVVWEKEKVTITAVVLLCGRSQARRDGMGGGRG